MKRILGALILGLLALAMVAPADAQWETINTTNVRPTTATGTVTVGPSATSGCTVLGNGELSCTQPHTDGYVFLPATEAVICTDPATLLNIFRPTRVASNDWAIAPPSGLIQGTATINCAVTLNAWIQRVGGQKGVKITSLDLVYQITAQALTSHNVACDGGASGANPITSCLGGLATSIYANNAADLVAAVPWTRTALATATQTNPYVTNIPVTTAVFLPNNIRTAVSFEWQAVGVANGIYRVYGVGVNFQVLGE